LEALKNKEQSNTDLPGLAETWEISYAELLKDAAIETSSSI
jgi:hypothetical protein